MEVAVADSAPSVKIITQEEVAGHNADGDLWLIIDGKVYDVSPYMAKHPGGQDILLENGGGKDATEPYTDADHTKRARELLKKYYVGDLAQWEKYRLQP